ncbi:TetR/AcrR family transcriptional regulator [Flavobacterium gilvum]|uniref:TetR family transcriptional regulator n=1 Tax=Flavobacterium gilvum TaxID=1492737 RepID=A0AAC9I4U0_9FLAO|nr:TetR family transcriptional regulator [Flavobacterium gilvum]AOW10869.1 TetR family transcriptional regulator [Flavobacterium gilvum]KFC61109.1 transcriptional regulator [Flavobacterium gilvum]
MKTDFNEKQIQILQVAETLFAEKGFDGTSIRDIAKEANINIAMVSYYFGSKEQLLESIILNRVAAIKIQLDILTLEDLDPLQKMHKLIEMYIDKINSNRCIYKIIHFEFSSSQRVINLQAFTDLKKENLKSLESIIQDGQEKGVFRKDVVVPLLTTTILGTYFHFHLNRFFYQNLLNLNTEEEYNTYIKTTLTMHIQQTIKALLTYES